MKTGPSVHLGRAFAVFLAATVLTGIGLCSSAAQTFAGYRPQTAPPPTKRLAKPLSSYDLHDLPLQRISQEEFDTWKARANRALGREGVSLAAAPAPPSTTPQFTDLTTTPRPPQVGASTAAREIHPFWSWDQQYIFFASNNIDPITSYGISAPPANALFHIYRITSEGAFIQQMTGTTIAGEATGQQLYPALNRAQTKLAYVHRDSPADPYQLYILDFQTNQRTRLTGISVDNNPLNAQIVSVERPSWSPGDNLIAFAARNQSVANDVRNIYVVDVSTRVVRKLTNGTPANGVESIDPVYHPDTQRVTFAANATGINAATGDLNYARTAPLQDLDTVDDPLRGGPDGRVGPYESENNLFTVSDSGPTASNPNIQLTFGTPNDVEPAYQQSDYPAGTPQGSGGPFNNWLAFSSLNRQPNANNPPGTTYDIYFIDGRPESVNNVAIRLFTPDTNAGALPLNQSQERYPTWSAGLPPQNPIDRIAFSSDRINNTQDPLRPLPPPNPNDLNRNRDIWLSEVTDITPPTLFAIGDDALNIPGLAPGEVLHISNAPLRPANEPPNPGRRVGIPGETFYFYAKLKDLQYGIDSVWIQIKDPDGPSTDAQGQNHKLFGSDPYGQPGGGPVFLRNTYVVRTSQRSHIMHIPYETDCEGIGISDYQYYGGPNRFDPTLLGGSAGGRLFASNARYASYAPGVDDAVRWSGRSFPPPNDGFGNPRWLRLADDGNFPDLVAGDDIFSARWITPNDGSDFYVDLVAYDKAINPKNVAQQGNWVIYDNIWGFSTQSLVSRNPVLVVDDNGSGQKWPRGIKGEFRPFPEFRLPTESDIMDKPSEFYPREVRGPDPTMPSVGPLGLTDIQDPGGAATGVTNETFNFLNGNAVAYDFITWNTSDQPRGTLRAYKYDLWRILAKGALPEVVLNDYVPTRDQQPLDVQGNQNIQRPVPRRAVVWNAPFTGDIFLGSGTILDQATQTLLRNYRDRAGRLVVAGGDIAWALTVNGTVQQQFVSDVLGARFLNDESYGNVVGYQSSALADDVIWDAAGRNFEPDTSNSYWTQFFDPDPLGTATSWPNTHTNPYPPNHQNGDLTAGNDGTPFRTQDVIEPVDATWVEPFDTRMVAKHDQSKDSKTVFMSFSLASMGRRFIAQDDNAPLNCMNYKAKVSHAMFCWMFSAELVGQVRNINGGAPIAGAWVQAYQGNTLVGSAFTKVDGTYTIRGLPVGAWSLRVDFPGFLGFNKQTSESAHGLIQSREDVFLTPAAPGSISGKVTDAFGQPVPNVQIRAVLRANPLFTGQTEYLATTGPDGSYLIPSVPTGTYDVSVGTLPPLFANPTPTTQPATVLPAQDTPNINFTVQGQAGPLTVTVFEQNASGTTLGPLAGVDVTLLSNGQAIPGQSGTTAADGTVSFTNVPAGPIQVSAFRFGFQEGTRMVNIPQDQTVSIFLIPATPRDIFGMVRRAIDGAPLEPRDLPMSLQLIRRASGLTTGRTADVFAPPASVPVAHNYRLQNAQEGAFTVALRNHPRYLDAQVNVDVIATEPNVAPDLVVQGRPGILSGTVLEDNNGAPGAPISAAQVIVVSERAAPGTTVANITTGTDGRFATPSIASDLYTVTVRKFGHSTRTLTGVFLAGDTDLGNILLVRERRGQVYGIVRRAIDQAPRGGVVVQFWTPSSSPYGELKITEVTSSDTLSAAPDGGQLNYTAGSTSFASEFLPAGDYEIRVSGDPRFASFVTNVRVLPDQAVRADLDLTPLPGILRGTVRTRNSDGSVGDVLPGAQVQISRGGSAVDNVTTDQSGQYVSTSALAAGAYEVTASAFGFFPASVSVFIEGPTTAPDIVLTAQPPSTISGLVSSSTNGTPIEGVLLELLPASGSGAAVATAISSGAATGEPPANYTLVNVPAGTYILRASRSGWSTAQRTVVVNPGSTLTGINLQLDPSHTFGQGLFLISLPEDFPGGDAADVLGIPRNTFRAAYWQPGRGQYAIYPAPAASEWRLGKGMFVRFNQRTAFTRAGTPAPDAPFFLPIKAGWNTIGSVRKTRIEWLRVQVATADGQTRTMQQAMDAGIIQNGLFGYVDGYFRSDHMDPFAGYFVRAFQDCTLVIPTSNGNGNVALSAPRGKSSAPAVAQVAAELEAAGLVPGTGLGRSRPADVPQAADYSRWARELFRQPRWLGLANGTAASRPRSRKPDVG